MKIKYSKIKTKKPIDKSRQVSVAIPRNEPRPQEGHNTIQAKNAIAQNSNHTVIIKTQNCCSTETRKYNITTKIKTTNRYKNDKTNKTNVKISQTLNNDTKKRLRCQEIQQQECEKNKDQVKTKNQ